MTLNFSLANIAHVRITTNPTSVAGPLSFHLYFQLNTGERFFICNHDAFQFQKKNNCHL